MAILAETSLEKPAIEPKSIAIFGSTGSVGCSTLEVVRQLSDRLRVVGLSAHQNLDELCRQAREFKPAWIIATDCKRAEKFRWPSLPGTDVLIGHDQLQQRAADPGVHTVVAAIVGTAGLRSTWAALEAGKTVALANKETLVAAGPRVMELVCRTGGTILPVDSEHNAIFQCLQSGRRREVARIILTASGGPFRRWTREQMGRASSEQAVAHPNWEMGQKISVDSATMMNKALEIIEARWLFELDPGQIEVVVHPQSIVHSMVEFVDGSVIAQLSPPDMKLPIQHALTYPDRLEGPAEMLDFGQSMSLDFSPPDLSRFPALALGLQVARMAGTAGAVLNAANEAAVDAFLKQRIGFTDIVRACQSVLEHHPFHPHPTLDQIIDADRWAREEIGKWICI